MNILRGRGPNGKTTYHVYSESATKRNHGIPSYHQLYWDSERHCWVCDCLAHKTCKHIRELSEYKQQEAAHFRASYAEYFYDCY